ncbi:MAG: hypothetical protein RLZZ301_882 [Bacteroidota bacterium]|jgi:hypothetical protein
MKMRRLLFLILLSFSHWASAHEFYFAYAEIELNELKHQFEGTVIFSTHDLEKAVEPSGALIGKLEQVQENGPELALLTNYLNKHLLFHYGCALDSNAIDAFCTASWTIEGIVTQLNGTIEIYVSAAAHAVYGPIHIQFDALMERFNEEQNKLTFIYRNHKQTLQFTPQLKQQYLLITP